MYYEIFEELRHGDGKGKTSALALINKSFIDCFYEARSEINPIYDQAEDYKRLTGKNYSYLYYQKIISGISKAIFLGLDPWSFKSPVFLESGRIKVPESSLFFDMRHPCLYFEAGGPFSYASSCFQKWEDELLASEEGLNKRLKLHITREGFRAHIYRILEILYSMRSSSPKRRTAWTVFLHELVAQQKQFSPDDLAALNFKTEALPGGRIQVREETFPTLDYLEFRHSARLGRVETAELAKRLAFEPEAGNPMASYQAFNARVLGELPICHFYINEHMFIGKEEHHLSAYYDFYVAPWTKGKDIKIQYLDNITGEKSACALSEFPERLRHLKYAIVLGFYEQLEDRRASFYAEPKMVKD